MRRLYTEFFTRVGKPFKVQRYEYYIEDGDDIKAALQQIRYEHPTAPIAIPGGRMIEVVYVKEAEPIEVPATDKDIKQLEENYGTIKKKRSKSKGSL